MIIPAFTSWPANIFTPSIFGLESRPLREEPRPFLCAIIPFFVAFFGRPCGFAAAFGFGLPSACPPSPSRPSPRSARRLLADRLDLDLRQLGAEAVVAPVAGPPAVLADQDLVAELVADDLGRHLDALRRELGLAVAADEQHLRVEGLALVDGEPVHEEPLALLDAVLLAAEFHDRIRHKNRRVDRAGRAL